MALRTVLKVPDPRLRIKAAPVASVDDRVRLLMDDMLETMYHEDGMGLAATQIGISQRVIVIHIPGGSDTKIYKIANPEILWHSPETAALEEACLSVPAQSASVIRAAEVKVQYLDENNHPQEMHAKGLLAACIQHEIDHLDGKLFVDHLSQLKRSMLLQRAQKQARLQKAYRP
ncbi:MAG: peptide deformylase [Holosporales bacterium]